MSQDVPAEGTIWASRSDYSSNPSTWRTVAVWPTEPSSRFVGSIAADELLPSWAFATPALP
jgi:hypothetical protein